MTQTALQDIVELMRVAAPTLRPQAIAFDGVNLWIGSIETERLYAVAPATWTVTDEISVPGKPWGMTIAGDELLVLLGQTDADHRTIYRVVPGHGLRNSSAIPCPEDTGSHLSYDGDRLYVSQWYNKRIIALDDAGKPGTVVDVPHEICGHTVVAGCFYCVTTDDEKSGTYYLTRVDARGPSTTSVDLATIPFNARGLAFDGERFWTNDREIHQTVSFARPD
jgi:sugar lactone lactonase YvrE